MIMNIQQNAGPPVYAPPPPQQAAPAPVIIQQEQKSKTCCIVGTTICCVVFIIPVIIYAVVIIVRISQIRADYSSSTYTTPTSAPHTFINAGVLSYSANICNGNFTYTATGSGSLISPNYPSNYPPGSNCINRIKTASDGVTFQINAFHTEAGYDTVVFNGAYTFHGDYMYMSGGLQVGDRFSFSDSQVVVYFTSDHFIQKPGFNFLVIDGYEPHNDISFLGYASRITNKEDLPIKTV